MALRCGLLALREAQTPPRDRNWSTWLLLGGRGSGKTRAGAEWVHGLASAARPFGDGISAPIALIGETIADVRDVMIEGPAGILRSALYNRPVYEATRRRLVWPTGAVAQVFSAHDPGSLRGPQFAAAWCDARTIWAAIVSIAASGGAALGLPVEAAAREGLTDAVLQLVSAAAGAVAIFGRIGATTQIR
ncbi:terminase large subunit domain-containing protein [Oceaniradius stylonematis]|uniref:terminase large subunit domain-containing protein n=1 Tax=Oceaniradius stylonematis TaxID=2184161 RepID=UPI003D1859A5